MGNIDFLYLNDLSDECISDLARPGQADDSVAYWAEELKSLQASLDMAKGRDCLLGYGAWDEAEIASMSDDEVFHKIIWLAAVDFSEGAEIFVLER